MKGASYTEEQSIGATLEYEAGARVDVLCLPQAGYFQQHLL